MRAVRDGAEAALPAARVLAGELLLLEAGDILCADGLLLEGVGVRADESALTGESDDRPKARGAAGGRESRGGRRRFGRRFAQKGR